MRPPGNHQAKAMEWGVGQTFSTNPLLLGANGVLCSCSPEIEAPYVREEEKERLLGLYQYLHSRAHNSSRPLKNIYFTGPRENLLAWVRAVCRVWVSPSSLVLHGGVRGWWHNAAPAPWSPWWPPGRARSFCG